MTESMAEVEDRGREALAEGEILPGTESAQRHR